VVSNQRARIYEAMIELVARKGYKAVTVRDLVRLAGVSTRTFYEQFTSKEDCFTQTFDAIVQGATRRIFSPQAYVGDPRDRQREVVSALMRELENGPRAARLTLIDALDAGPAILEHARRVERGIEAMLAECLASSPGGIQVPPLIVEGMVAGALDAARSCLSTDRPAGFDELESDLIDWASCYFCDATAALTELDRNSVWRNTALQPLPAQPRPRDGTYVNDRALILAAVAELAVGQGYAGLTTQRIHALAGVSRKKFGVHFTGVEDCFLAALEWKSREACAQTTRAITAAQTVPGGIYRAIVALSDHVPDNRLLAEICVHDDFAPGAKVARARQRLISTLIEQLVRNNQAPARFSDLTATALWVLLCRHAFRDSSLRAKTAATLSFVALAPTVGGAVAISAIRQEQA